MLCQQHLNAVPVLHPQPSGYRSCARTLRHRTEGPGSSGGLRVPQIYSALSQGRQMSSTRPQARLPAPRSHHAALLREPTWPESEHGHRLPQVLGGGPPSSEVLQPLPGASSSSEPATTKSDREPGTLWAKSREASGSEIRASCWRRGCGMMRKGRREPFSDTVIPSFPRTLCSQPWASEAVVRADTACLDSGRLN